MIKKFRNKPFIVEALKWEVNFEGLVEMAEFMGSKFKLDTMDASKLSIDTYTGEAQRREFTVKEGDWVLKALNGEFYPCRLDIFEKTYEEI